MATRTRGFWGRMWFMIAPVRLSRPTRTSRRWRRMRRRWGFAFCMRRRTIISSLLIGSTALMMVWLMPDPLLTGLLSSEDEATVTDYLGRAGPVSTKGSPTLPVGGAPVTGGAGPVAPGGTGVGPTFTGGGGARGTRPAGDEVAGRIAGLGQKVLEQLRRGGAFDDSPSGARNPETDQAFPAQRAGERAGLAGAGAEPATLAALRAGASPTTITGEFSPEIQALF